MESESTDAPVWPWILAGLAAIAVVAGVVYLMVSRTRREKALDDASAEHAQDAAGPGSTPGTPSDSDH